MCTGWDPQSALTVFHVAVLAREVVADAFTHVVLPALGKVASASAERRLDGSISGNPVGEGVFAILNDTVLVPKLDKRRRGLETMSDLRLASLIAIISFTGLSWSHWGVVDKFQKMLSEASNDGELLTVLLESIELVSESCL